MLLLAIDTAGPNCAVALARASGGETNIIAHANERIGHGHAERLAPMVAAVLARAGAGYADLGRVAVTVGPGSFTGVRVGIAFARGLGLALDIPAVGVGSLDALVCPLLRSGAGTAAAVLDAKRGEVYALAKNVQSRAELVEAQALSVTDLAERLGHVPQPVVLTGSGAQLVADTLPAPASEIVDAREAPDIADVVALALSDETYGPAEPHYARAADAKPQLDKAVARL
jgi:tRNA threonylcarbamoyladenosine biosynthesis protein TsaB